MTLSTPTLTSRNVELDLSSEAFGALRDSSALAFDGPALRERMAQDGYLFLPGLLDRDEVLDARRFVAERLMQDGQLEPGTDPMECLAASEGAAKPFRPELSLDNPPLMRVLYSGPMMRFYERFLNGPVRHFDYTWFRAVPPGQGTGAHTDAVFMNRGTLNLFTSWTPFGDVPLDVGGLMILEKSHQHRETREGYSTKDVDTFCENSAEVGMAQPSGALPQNPAELRESIGGRWLTGEYRAGDVLVFSIFTIHGSLDNRSRQMRLSSDSRYQLASESADERWIGEKPLGHGPAAKRGLIC